MAPDGTELQFVRCPSCRSLVPAVSTRCRMCGATLDAAGAAKDNGTPDAPRAEATRPARVRQRTMAGGGSELGSVAEKLREEQSPIEEAPPVAAAMKPAAAEEVDPLGKYLESFEDDDETSLEEDPFFNDDGDDSDDEETQELNSDDLDSEDVDTEDDFEDDLDDLFVEDDEELPEPVIAAPKAEEKLEPVSPLIQKPVIASEPEVRETPRVISRPVVTEKIATEVEKPYENGNHAAAAPVAPVRAPAEVVAKVADSIQEAPSNGVKAPVAKIEEAPVAPKLVEQKVVAPVRREESTPKREEAIQGRLFGWLVSFSDDDGVSVELREGKCFVAGESLKGNDLVIDDPSISTPHAMFTVSAVSGFIVQDLMSERGVFVRRRSQETYRREDESVVVEHGDWLRFGDVEFLVCLVPNPGDL